MKSPQGGNEDQDDKRRPNPKPFLQDDWVSSEHSPILESTPVSRRELQVRLTSTWAPHSVTGDNRTERRNKKQKFAVQEQTPASTWEGGDTLGHIQWAWASLGYIARSCLKVSKQQINKTPKTQALLKDGRDSKKCIIRQVHPYKNIEPKLMNSMSS